MIKIDKALEKRIVAWLESPADSRNIEEGATLLLKLNRNAVFYQNVVRRPHKYAATVEYQLKKFLNKNLIEVTHEQVEEMSAKVDVIVANRLSLEQENPAEGFRSGKRPDHDSLPMEIQALYVENKSLVQRMREVHAHLRIITGKPGFCPDSDRYPFLKELIELDKRLHKNWEHYDNYGSEQPTIADAREAARRARGFINLQKARYRKNPSEELKAKLQEQYALIPSPTEKMTAELKELGVIE